MPKQPFYKIGSAFLPATPGNTKQDPNKGEGPDYKTYTDPKTGKQGKLDSGRSYSEAYKIAQDKGLTVPGESLQQYSNFAKSQLANYRETGVWKSRKDLGFQDRYDTIGRGEEETVSSGGSKREPTKSVNAGIKPKGKIDQKIKPKAKTFPTSSTKSTSKNDGGTGLVRRALQGKFAGDVVDKNLARLGTGRAGKQFVRSLKKESAAEGMTGRERRLQKQLSKATANMAAAGGSVTKSRDGKVVNRSNTGGIGANADAAYKGRARKKAFKAVTRANRISSRMKAYEGDNYSRAFEK
jgi:hypothetical protein